MFFRLFTLLEDRCHVLDLEMAASMAASTSMEPSVGDKERFTEFTAAIRRERELLDENKRLEDQVKWLEQTLSLLILSPTSSNDPSEAVETAIKGRKEKITAVVSMHDK